jgi:hypothetical protein
MERSPIETVISAELQEQRMLPVTGSKKVRLVRIAYEMGFETISTNSESDSGLREKRAHLKGR